MRNSNEFSYTFNIAPEGNPFSSFELENVTEKKLNLEQCWQLDGSAITISLPCEALHTGVSSYVIYGMKAGEKRTKLASITFSQIHIIPDVTLIVGAPRSGTTALGGSLRKSTGFCAHEESHIAPLFQQLVSTCNNHFTNSQASKNVGTLSYDITATHVEAELLETLRRLHRGFYGDKFVIDKTPGIPMIEALPILMRTYPQAKVIFCKRRGIENVRSRVIKFADTQFESHCRQWAETFAHWRNAQKVINAMLGHSGWQLEIEQFELANHPEPLVIQIAQHLGLTQEQKEEMLKFLKSERPQQSFEKNAISIENTGWPESDISTFKRHCDSEMKRQGYSYAENYYLS